jgi:hypothetical protein
MCDLANFIGIGSFASGGYCFVAEALESMSFEVPGGAAIFCVLVPSNVAGCHSAKLCGADKGMAWPALDPLNDWVWLEEAVDWGSPFLLLRLYSS